MPGLPRSSFVGRKYLREAPDFVESVVKRRRCDADHVRLAKIAFHAGRLEHSGVICSLILFSSSLNQFQNLLIARMTSEGIKIGVMFNPCPGLVISVRE